VVAGQQLEFFIQARGLLRKGGGQGIGLGLTVVSEPGSILGKRSCRHGC